MMKKLVVLTMSALLCACSTTQTSSDYKQPSYQYTYPNPTEDRFVPPRPHNFESDAYKQWQDEHGKW